MVVTVKGAPKNMSFQTFKVDSAFIDMYQIQIYEDRKMPFDKNNWFISESASKDLGGVTDYVMMSEAVVSPLPDYSEIFIYAQS